MTQLGLIKSELINLQTIADKTANSLANALNGNGTSYNGGSYTNNGGSSAGGGSGNGGKSVSVGSSVTVSPTATEFSRDGGNGTTMLSFVPGSTYTVMQVDGNEVVIGRDGVPTGWVNASDLVGYGSASNSGGGSGGSSGGGGSRGGSSSNTIHYSGSGINDAFGLSNGGSVASDDGVTYAVYDKNQNYLGSINTATGVVTSGSGGSANGIYNSGLNTAVEALQNEGKLPHHAKGTTGVKSDELAWIDEHGLEEIVMHAQGGKLAYLTKGSAVIPHDISENLMELGKVDPKTWMDKNRPTTVPQSFVVQNNNFDLKFGSLINIEHADKDSIPEIQAAVQKQLDSYMKNLNAGIKRYAR